MNVWLWALVAIAVWLLVLLLALRLVSASRRATARQVRYRQRMAAEGFRRGIDADLAWLAQARGGRRG